MRLTQPSTIMRDSTSDTSVRRFCRRLRSRHGRPGSRPLDFRPFDADNHYYEAEDAFTRHVEPEMAKRCMQWADVGGKRRLLVGGKINKFIPNPTFDPIARPGSLEDYLGRNEAGVDLKEMFGDLEPIADHPGLPPA